MNLEGNNPLKIIQHIINNNINKLAIKNWCNRFVPGILVFNKVPKEIQISKLKSLLHGKIFFWYPTLSWTLGKIWYYHRKRNGNENTF